MCKPKSLVVLAVDYGIPETCTPSGEPTTHCDKDHHGYALVVHRANCTVRTKVALLVSQVGRYDILTCGGPLTYLLPML